MPWTGFANMVRVEMARRRWNQVRLAEETGISRQTVNRILKGEATSSDNVLRIMEALNVHFIALDVVNPMNIREAGAI